MKTSDDEVQWSPNSCDVSRKGDEKHFAFITCPWRLLAVQLKYSEILRSFWNVYDRLVYRLLHGIDRDVSTCPLVVIIRRWSIYRERLLVAPWLLLNGVTPTLLMLTRNIFVTGSVSNCSLSDPLFTFRPRWLLIMDGHAFWFYFPLSVFGYSL